MAEKHKAIILTLERMMQEDGCEFKAGMSYIVSSNSVWTAQWDFASSGEYYINNFKEGGRI